MKYKKIIVMFSLYILTALSACGAEQPATPALNVDDIQQTAMAQAWAAVTQTQAAMPTVTPTNTLPPPTETFTPFPTLVQIPTLSIVQPQPTLVIQQPSGDLPSAATTDPCTDIPPVKPNGAIVNVKFVNKSGGQVDLHFGMNAPNQLGECGTYYFPISRNDQPVVTVLAGCYWAYAYVNGEKPSNAKSVESLCVTDPARQQSIWIGQETINFH